MEDHAGEKRKDGESDGRIQPTLLLMSGKMTEKVSKMDIFSVTPYIQILKGVIPLPFPFFFILVN